MTMLPTDSWTRRFEAARADLLTSDSMVEVQTRLASAGPVAVFGDLPALRRARRVGAFAGSFNPQTVAHAVVAEAARMTEHLDVLLWVLARVAVDKEDVSRATLVDRVAQLQAFVRAAAPQDAVVVMDAGLYADQAETIRGLVGPDREIYLIVGFDKVVQIFDARYYENRDATLHRLFATASLLAVPRAGHGAADLLALLAQPENRRFGNNIKLLPTRLDVARIASTHARDLLRSDVDPSTLRDLLTPEGAALALATGAYRSNELLSDGTALDRYGMRNLWLASLRPER